MRMYIVAERRKNCEAYRIGGIFSNRDKAENVAKRETKKSCKINSSIWYDVFYMNVDSDFLINEDADVEEW